MNENNKRLFFGLSLEAPWPTSYPKGRIIQETMRHITLAFLGNFSFSKLEKELDHFPKPAFKIGPVGETSQVLFLPKGHKPRVVAHEISWLVDGERIEMLHKNVLDWLEKLDYPVDRRPLLSHVTIARAPFENKEWEEAFEELPIFVSGIHLYESLGNLHYKSIWEYSLIPCFEELEHTADVAFQVCGTSFHDLYIHGALALSFSYPPFLTFLEEEKISDFEQLVRLLNVMITKCDAQMGCPFKAVSYHGNFREDKENGLLYWEMIVDV